MLGKVPRLRRSADYHIKNPGLPAWAKFCRAYGASFLVQIGARKPEDRPGGLSYSAAAPPALLLSQFLFGQSLLIYQTP